MMARTTGEEAQRNALLRESYSDGVSACKEFYGLASWDCFYEGSFHPEIREAFKNGWYKQAEIEGKKR